MNQEQSVDLAQTLMKELMSLYKFHEPSTSEKIFYKLKNLNPVKFSRFSKVGPLVLVAVNLLIHYLKNKQIISPQTFRKFFSLSMKNFKEGRFINLLTYAFSHISLPHLLTNIILFYGYSNNIGSRFGAKRMFLIYVLGAIVSGIAQYIQQRKNKDSTSYNGSNGGYTALAGYTAMLYQNSQSQMFGMNVPVWLSCLLSTLCCATQKSNDGKNQGTIEFTGFLTGALLYLIEQQLPQSKNIHNKEILISIL